MGTDLSRAPGDELIGTSRPMRELFALVGKVAPHSMSVLISGDTGTGKELIVHAIHRLGRRRDGPLVSVSCSSLGEALFASEIFGHVRGAFTTLTEDRAGVFERAHGGTLLLDDVDGLPMAVQARLLSVLETGRVARLGSNAPTAVDVRVIATTKRALERDIVTGRFRADLYHRLSVVQVRVPPLRDRRGDIPALIEHLLDRISRAQDRPLRGVTAGALRRIVEWDWPGNVRELHNVLASAAAIAATDLIEEGDLRELARPPAAPVTPIAELERAEVARAMAETHGNKMEAARRLGISRRALYRRLEKFGLGPNVSKAA